MIEIREQIEFACDHLNDYMRGEGELNSFIIHGAFQTMEKLLAVYEAVRFSSSISPEAAKAVVAVQTETDDGEMQAAALSEIDR